jgi:starvation-inducible DNA-binding protein
MQSTMPYALPHSLRQEGRIMNHPHPDAPKRKKAEPLLVTSNETHAAICSELKRLLADVFAIYIKTKNFHWHMSGPEFHDYHLLLDEHAIQVFAMTDVIAERARKLKGSTLHSIGDIARHKRVRDNDQELIPPEVMFEELLADNNALADNLRTAHMICDQFGDIATASLIESWVDETERRIWFLTEITRKRRCR